MTTIETEELGTLYTLTADESRVVSTVDLGGEVQLRSVQKRTGRVWYIQGERGMVDFAVTPEDTLALCEAWLDTHGYSRGGDLPPEVFEYRRYNAR